MWPTGTCESKLIEIVVGDVADKLNPTCLSVADYPVGLEGRVEQLTEFLNLESDNDVRIVAIWGMGGIGKTTIAKAMYNRIHRMFESSSFLVNVGRTSKQHNGIVELQEKLLCDILMDKNQKIRSEDHGTEEIKRRAWYRKVLLVLDDVDNISQLRALAINRDLFCFGSRIIVTTRDLSSVSSLQVDKEYKPHELNEKESLQLFSWHAFRKDHPVEDYDNLSKKIVDYAQGLPLVLEILGSFLSEKTISEWISQLKKLKKIPHDDVQRKLRLSFDSLDDEQKGLFLDIACFFVGMDQDLAIKILEGCEFFPESGIGVLSRRCLLSIDAYNRLMMHDRIQDMAREIVRKESPQEPGERSRLWYHEDILDVLRNNTGTKAIQGIFLNLSRSEEIQVNANAFTKMKRLRLLHLNYVHLIGSYEHLSGRLVWLSWKGFPLKCVPSTLIMDKMVAIDLSYSRLKHVWRGAKGLQEQGEFNIFLPGSEVPRWCNYQSEGYFLRFRVPDHHDELVDRKIQGFILCVIFFGRRKEDDDKFSVSYSIKNISKRAWGFDRQPRVDFYPIRCEDQMWLTYIPNRCLESKLRRENNRLDSGDAVEISIQVDYIWQVKKCGVSLVYEGDDGSEMSSYDEEAMIECMKPSAEEGDPINIASDFRPAENDVAMRWIPTDLKFLEEIGKLEKYY